jgi:hypothetical protein
MAARLMALVLLAFPALAWACPYCALRPETHRVLYSIGAMVLLPWLVGGTAIVIIRRIERLDQDSKDNPHE